MAASGNILHPWSGHVNTDCGSSLAGKEMAGRHGHQHSMRLLFPCPDIPVLVALQVSYGVLVRSTEYSPSFAITPPRARMLLL